MAVSDWLPWVLAAGGGVFLLDRAGVFRGAESEAEQADRSVPVSLGDRIVPGLLQALLNRPDPLPQAAPAAQPAFDPATLVAQVIGGITGVLQALPGTGPLSTEIPAGAAQAINIFTAAPATPASATPVVTEIGGQHSSGAVGELVRQAVMEGLPVPEGVITWVTTNRRGPNPNTSGRNYETNPLQPHERDQVRAAIGMNASVAKELVDAFNAGQGVRGSATAGPLGTTAATGLIAQIEAAAKALANQALANPPPAQGGAILGNLGNGLGGVGLNLPGLLENGVVSDSLQALKDRAFSEVGEIFSGVEGPYVELNRTPFFNKLGGFKIPEFKIPEIITDPEQALKDSLKDAATEAGSAAWQAAEQPVTRGYRAVEGTAVGTNLALRGVGKIPVVGPAASGGLKAIPGIGLLGKIAPLLVVGDVVATGYEFATRTNVPVLGYRELFPYETFADWWAFADESR